MLLKRLANAEIDEIIERKVVETLLNVAGEIITEANDFEVDRTIDEAVVACAKIDRLITASLEKEAVAVIEEVTFFNMLRTNCETVVDCACIFFRNEFILEAFAVMVDENDRTKDLVKLLLVVTVAVIVLNIELIFVKLPTIVIDEMIDRAVDLIVFDTTVVCALIVREEDTRREYDARTAIDELIIFKNELIRELIGAELALSDLLMDFRATELVADCAVNERNEATNLENDAGAVITDVTFFKVDRTTAETVVD